MALIAAYPLAREPDARISFLNTYGRALSSVSGADVVLVGDSIMRGDGLWFASLQKHPLAVINLARGGFTTPQLVPIAQQAASMEPNTVLFMAGTNDVGQRVDPSRSASAFGEILDALQDRGARVIVTLSPPTARHASNVELRSLNETFRALAADRGATVIDLWPDLSEGEVIAARYTSDGTHLTDEAYRIWAEQLREAIRQTPR